MAIRSKNSLKEFFQTGFRPTESNFADLVDSFVHKNSLTEDGSSFNDQTLTVARGLRLGTDPVSPPNLPGTIRWNAATTSFEVNTDGTATWHPIGGGVWTQAGNDATFSGGNARVDDAVMGTLSSGPFTGWAVMGHQNSISAGGFAMGQAPTGAIGFVASADQSIEFNHLGGQYAVFSTAGISLNTNTTISGGLTITSTTQGVLMPRMTAVQASAIASPADGLIIYVRTTNATFTTIGFWGRENGNWVKL